MTTPTTEQPKESGDLSARRLWAMPEVIMPLVVGLVILNLAAVTSSGGIGAGGFVVMNLVALVVGGTILMLAVSSGEWVMAGLGALILMGVTAALVLGTWDLSPAFAIVPSLAALGFLDLMAINFARRRDPAIEPEPLIHAASGWLMVTVISAVIATGMTWLGSHDLTNWLWFAGASAALLGLAVVLTIALIASSDTSDKRRYIPGQRLLPAPREELRR